jgi:hypothetical protein
MSACDPKRTSDLRPERWSRYALGRGPPRRVGGIAEKSGRQSNGRRYEVFFGKSLLLGFPGADEAKGEAVAAAFFLFAFGFFFSRLLLFWPFATVSS